MKRNKPKANRDYFPAQNVSNAEKASMEYGAVVGNSIQSDWFRRDSGTSRFYANRREFHRLRLYARAEQPTQQYKDRLEIDGDSSYLNLDWEPVHILPKFVDIIVNGMQNRLFKVKSMSIDPTASADREKYFSDLKGEMDHKQSLMGLEQLTGQDVFKNKMDTLPESEEELMLHSELKYKQGIEIASELSIQHVLESNQYNDVIKRRIDEDLVILGIGAAKHSFYANEGIKVDYVDPSDLVYSYNESPYFEDATYFGEVKRVNLLDLQKQFPELSDEELEEVKQVGRGFYDYQELTYNDADTNHDQNLVEILYFSYKTTENNIHKIKKNVNGGKVAVPRDETFQSPKTKEADFKKVNNVREVVYEGAMVLGESAKVLKWEKAKNMIRPKSSFNSVVMPYSVAAPKYYNGRIDSTVGRITKYADFIQIAHLKIQQVIQRMNPAGIYIDMDGINNIDLGNGQQYSPREAMNMYFQTGSVIGRSKTIDDEVNHGKVPIQELQGSTGAQLRPLVEMYNFYMEQIQGVTGVNAARDGSNPEERALVGVQKLAAANSNTATRHILDAGLHITKILAEGVSLRISDVLEYSNLKSDFVRAVGKHNTAILLDAKNLHLHDFGISIEIEPDEEEKAVMEANIQVALTRDQIYIEDAMEVRSVNNPKLAAQLLRVLRRKKEERDAQVEDQRLQANTQSQSQIASSAKEAEAQAYQVKAQSEGQLEQLKSQLLIQNKTQEKDLEIELLMVKQQLQLEILQAQGLINLNSGAQKIQGASMLQKEKATTDKVTNQGGGTSPISVENKSNTIDGKLGTSGLL